MERDVRLCISGSRLAYINNDFEDESISVTVSGKYEQINDTHKITYEELDDEKEVIYNTILITKDSMKIQKEGITNSIMNFSKEKKPSETKYSTPFGDIFMRILTHDIKIEENKEKILVDVDYSLSIEQDLLSNSKIRVDVTFK